MKLKNIVLGLVSALSVFAQAGEKLIKNSDRVVFMGDSITYYGVSDSHGYVNLVRKGLAANGINPAYWAGVGIKGDVSQQMRDRFDSHSGGQDVTPKNPTVVPISAGVNDLLHNVSYETYIANMKWMVDRTKAIGATPILLSPTATGYSEDDSDSLRKFAKGVRDLAASEGIAYAPIYEMFRGYVDDHDSPKVAYMNKDIVATCDACHMAPPGDRQFARAVLGAIGLDKDELSAAEAAWNSDDTLIPLGAYSDWIDHNVSISLSASEVSALNAAGGLRAVLKRGIPSLAANPVAEAEASGASNSYTVNKSTGYFNFKEYDQLLIAARKLNVTLESAIRYAVLRGVRNTAALSPSAPVVKSAEIHPGSTTATVEATIDAVGATASACDVFLKLGSGASQRIVVGENATFDYQVSGLQPNTTYTYELTFKNNATTSMTVTKSGSFKTLAAGPLQPTGWDDAPMIQSALDAAVPSHGTVTLAGGVFNLGAELMVTGGVTLVGQGYDQTTLYQHSPHRGVTVADGSTLEGVTVQGGKTMSNWDHGAGVYLKNGTVTGCRVRWNYAGWAGSNIYGGGIYVEKGTIAHSVICENTVAGAACDGAGIGWRYSGGPVTIDTCLIYGNTTTTGTGGGIAVVAGNPEISIKNSTIASNSAKNGGGISLDSQAKKVTLTNSIVSGNTVTGGSDVNMKGTLASASSNNVTADTVVFSDPSSGDFRVVSGASGIGYDEFNDTSAPHTHTWGTATYSWSADYATCTASATCTGDSTHKTNKTVTATSAVVKEATTTETGTKRYTATFAAPFATQTKDVTIPKVEETTPGGDTPSNPPVVNPPSVDPTGALTASGDTTGATDTKTIQDLIDAAAPTQGTVKLGEGTFYLNTQLMVTNGVTLTGLGSDKTILRQTVVGAGGNGEGGYGRCATVSGGATLFGVTVTGCRISAPWTHGAGLYVDGGTVSWCCISNNVGTGRNSYGGGISIADGTIDHCVIANNQGGEYTCGGGGIVAYNVSGTILIDSCLVYGNTASVKDQSGKGGGICITMNNPKVTIRNTTVTANTVGGDGGGLYLDTYSNGNIKLVNSIAYGNTASNNADVKGTTNSNWTNNLISVDPLFANAAAGNYTLTASSPAKGAGVTYSGIGLDLKGASFANPPSIGCYEFGSAPAGGGEEGGEVEPPAKRPCVILYVD